MIKTFEQFISESCSSSNCMLSWTEVDGVNFKKLNSYVLKKKNTARKGGYSFKLITIPMGGVDMPMSKHDDTPISEYINKCEFAINVEDIQDWNSNNDLKSSLTFGDSCLIRYPRFEQEKRLDPKRTEEQPYHYEVQLYLGGRQFDDVRNEWASTIEDKDTIEWVKLD
jgi:hypothetical protein